MNDSPLITVAMLGARRRYMVPAVFARAGWLELFYTDIYGFASRQEMLSAPEATKSGACAAEFPAAKVRHFPFFGLLRLMRSRLAANPSARLHTYLQANRSFCHRVASRGLGNANGAYVFNAAGLEILKAARARGMKTFLDQITAPWSVEETILEEERRRLPGWESGRTTETDWRPLADREAEEWDLADCILCGSDFVCDGVRAASGPADKCRVVPYGSSVPPTETIRRETHEGPLRVLFAGTVQLRKGIQYLHEAAREIPPEKAQFRAAGLVQTSSDAARTLSSRIELLGPLNREALSREYAWADVFVLPSLSEGSANVCYEALAAGLPVITTPNTGSVVRDGTDGFIIPIRDAHSIRERLLQLADDRALLAQLSENARAHGNEFSAEHYGHCLMDVVLDTYRA